MAQERSRRCLSIMFCVLAIVSLNLSGTRACAATASEIDREVQFALEKLYAHTPVAAKFAKIAKGILVFPDVVKAGFVVGGQYGEGALLIGGKNAGYFNTMAASYGLQAGAQSFGYAMFLMTESAIEYLNATDGWEIGAGPTVVVIDEGVARDLTTTTAKEDVYTFIFDQKGLMAGLGIQGSKISRINPER